MEIKKITFSEKNDVKKEGISDFINSLLDPIWENGWQKCGFDCEEWVGKAAGNAHDSTKPCTMVETQKYSVWN